MEQDCSQQFNVSTEETSVAEEPPQSEPPQSEPPQSEPPQAEPPQAEPPQAEPPQAEPPQSEPPQAEPPQSEPPQSEPPQAEPPQSEPPQAGPPQSGPPKSGPPQAKPSQAELPQSELAPSEPPKSEPPQAKPSQAEPPQAEPPQSEPPQSEPPQSEPPQAGPPQAKPPQSGPPQAEPPRSKPPQSEPPQVELPQAEPPKAGPPQSKPPPAEPPQAEPPKAGPPQSKPPPAEPPQAEPPQVETPLREDDRTDEPEDQKDKNLKTSDHLRTSQRERRTISPLTLFKEDFTQFKEELLKVFRDRDQDRTSSQVEDKPASSTLDLLKEDLNQLREDMTSVFSSNRDAKSADLKTSLTAEKTNNRRSFFKDDLSNVFRISLLKDKDTVKEVPSKIKASKAERTDEPFLSLFRRDQKTSNRAKSGQETVSEPSEGPEDVSETKDTKEINNEKTEEGEDGEECDSVCEKSEEVSETPQTEEVIPQEAGRCDVLFLNPLAEQICEREETGDDFSAVSEEVERINGAEEEEDDEFEQEGKDVKAETLPSLTSVISLFGLRNQNKDDTRNHEGGDAWSVKNFACYLTLDPNTANSELHLTEGNRKATRVWSDHSPPDHPDRFERCPQVLCREGLLDSVYWEVTWSGGADIGVTYNNISRNGDPASCLLGHNKRSWSLECAEGCYTPCHDNKRFKSSTPQPFTRRVGVYLDWSAGDLSFYCVSKDTMVHLHTFTSTFSEPLYPAFWVWDYEGSVSLCQVELDWERLLQ